MLVVRDTTFALSEYKKEAFTPLIVQICRASTQSDSSFAWKYFMILLHNVL